MSDALTPKPVPRSNTAPKLGDVRFDLERGLETFDGADWVPLERLSDVSDGPVFKLEGREPREPQ